MTWLIVGGLLLLAFAPILWLMPTKRDRQLVKLRQQARREGLVVEITAVPKCAARPGERVGADGIVRDVTQPCSVYRLPAAKPGRRTHCWFLLRDGGGTTPLRGWTEHPRVPLPRMSDSAAYWRAVAAAVGGLEDHCLAVEAADSAVGWYWLENTRGREATALVGEIAERLRAIALLQARFEVATRLDE